MARYGVTVQNPTGALEGPRFVATCGWPGCRWKSATHVVKAGAEDDARHHRSWHRTDRGSATTAAVLLLLIFGGLAFLAAVHLGQRALCDLNGQHAHSYCPGYSATTNQEPTR